MYHNNNNRNNNNNEFMLFCQAIKPTVLIGSSGAGRTFTKDVVGAMASFNEVSILLFHRFSFWDGAGLVHLDIMN